MSSLIFIKYLGLVGCYNDKMGLDQHTQQDNLTRIRTCYNYFMKFNHLIPELYVANFQKSLDFYKNILGFTLEYQRINPLFAFLSYQGSQLMIQEDDNDEEWHNRKPEYPYGRGLNFQIKTDDVQKIIDSLQDNNYLLKRGVKDSWYKENETLHGCREILVMDPSGYLLRFSQGLGQKSVKS